MESGELGVESWLGGLFGEAGDLEVTEVDFVAFVLEADAAGLGEDVVGFVDLVAVDDDADVSHVADAFHAGPLAFGAGDVVFAAGVQDFFEEGLVVFPPHLSAGVVGGFAVGVPAGTFVCGDAGVAGDVDFGAAFAADDDEVAFATLGELDFEGGHPDASGGAVRAVTVEHDAGVADVFASVGLFAPFEFEGEMVVLVALFGGDVAAVVAALDVEDAVLEGEGVFGVFRAGGLEPGFKIREAISLEWGDGRPWGNGFVGVEGGNRQQEEGRQEFHAGTLECAGSFAKLKTS